MLLLRSMLAVIDLPPDPCDSAFPPPPAESSWPIISSLRYPSLSFSLLKDLITKAIRDGDDKVFPLLSLSLSLSLHRPLRVRGFFFDGLIPAAPAAAVGRSLLAHLLIETEVP